MNNRDNHPDRGGILVRTDRDDPTQGWLEMTVPMSELRLTDNPNGTAEPMVSIFFDYQSGSICELARIITEAHNQLVEALAERNN